MEEQTIDLLNQVVKNAEVGRTTAHQLLSVAQGKPDEGPSSQGTGHL